MSYKCGVENSLTQRPELLVDNRGWRIADPATLTIVGLRGPLSGLRMVYALPTNISGGDLSVRYHPPKDPNEVSSFGIDFCNVIGPGIGIVDGSATLELLSNTVPPLPTADLTASVVEVYGRLVYAQVQGGVDGSDYILKWTVDDSQGNQWARSTLMLCALTS